MSESAYNSPLPLRRFTDSCCSSPARSVGSHAPDTLTDSDGEGDLFVETPGPPEQTVIAGWLKFRDNKKWKQRWGVITKLSPAAVVLKIFAKLTAGRCKSKKCLLGKTAIVTGGNSGLGFHTALDLASRGCRVIIADIVDSEDSKNRIIAESGNANVVAKYLDLGCMESVRKFANDILLGENNLNLLINNAGCAGFDDIYTKDGMLKLMQINYFGSFQLTYLLFDLLKKTQGSRVLFTSSLFCYFNNIKEASNMNSPPTTKMPFMKTLLQYGNSKLCMVLGVRGFAKRFQKFGIICHAVHPGLTSTKIFNICYDLRGDKSIGVKIIFFLYSTIIYYYGKTPTEGSEAILECALSDEIGKTTGLLYCDGIAKHLPAIAQNEKICDEVWLESKKLLKLNNSEIEIS